MGCTRPYCRHDHPLFEHSRKCTTVAMAGHTSETHAVPMMAWDHTEITRTNAWGCGSVARISINRLSICSVLSAAAHAQFCVEVLQSLNQSPDHHLTTAAPAHVACSLSSPLWRACHLFQVQARPRRAISAPCSRSCASKCRAALPQSGCAPR